MVSAVCNLNKIKYIFFMDKKIICDWKIEFYTHKNK